MASPENLESPKIARERRPARPVVVFGAETILGSHVIYRLLSEGHHVRVAAADMAKDRFLQTGAFHPNAPSHLSLAPFDLADARVYSLADGCELCVSCLPLTSPPKKTYNSRTAALDYWRALNEGLLSIIEASGLSRVVSIFPVSNACEGKTRMDSELRVFTEHDWSDPAKQRPCAAALTQCELETWRRLEHHAVELRVILMADCFGPVLTSAHCDAPPSRHILALMKRDRWALPDVPMPAVDVRDAAALVNLVLESHLAGVSRRLICTCDDMDLTVRKQSACLEEAFAEYGFHPKVPRMLDITLSTRAVFSYRYQEWKARLGYSYRLTNARAKEEYRMTFRQPLKFLGDHALSLMKFGALSPKRVPASTIDEAMVARSRTLERDFFASSSSLATPPPEEGVAATRSEDPIAESQLSRISNPPSPKSTITEGDGDGIEGELGEEEEDHNPPHPRVTDFASRSLSSAGGDSPRREDPPASREKPQAAEGKNEEASSSQSGSEGVEVIHLSSAND